MRGTAAIKLIAGFAGFGIAASVAGPAAAQTSPSAFTTGYRYDAAHRTTGVIKPDPDGTGPRHYAAIRNTYDAAGNLIEVETGELSSWKSQNIAPETWSGFTVLKTVVTTYDLMGRKLTETVKGDDGVSYQLTQYSYDDMGRLECTAVRMNRAAYGSLPASACVQGAQGSDGPDRITRNHYDAAGQLLRVEKAVGTALVQDHVIYSYSASGKKASVTDARGYKAVLEYDGFDRQSKWRFPSKTTPGVTSTSDYELYQYDANGNRTRLRKRGGQNIYYSYDKLDRMTKKNVPGYAKDVYYGYDLQGLQLYARFASSSGQGITNSYDGFGELTSTTSNQGGHSRTVTHQYDADGNRTRLIPNAGVSFTYTYDGLDRPSGLYYGSGTGTVLATWTYDARQGVAEQATRYQSAHDSFSYDHVGRLASISDVMNASGSDVSWSYGYNPAGQLKTATRDNDAYAYTGHVNVDRNYATNGLNQYTSAGPASFTYDANGNLTSDGSTNYAYDAENRLLSAAGATSATLVYDPMGRLFQTSGGTAGTTQFVYDGDELVAEYDGANHLLRQYAHGVGDDDAVYWHEAGDGYPNRFFHRDHQGSIVAVTSTSGFTAMRNAYDEYGIPASTNQGRFQYTGQAWLPELGMYYYKARIYSPTLGRFLQTDPIGYDDQINLYAYVANDPVNGRDPTGLYECSGSKGDCGTIKGYVGTAQTALKGLDPKSDAAKKLSATLGYLGKPGEKNGVTIASSALAKGTLASAGPGGKISVDIKQINAYGANPAFAAANPGTSQGDIQKGLGAGALAHEARHELDFNRIGFPNSKASEYRTELNAYRTQQGVDQGSSLTTGMWSPTMSQSQLDAAVAAGAQSSTDSWCRSGGPC